MTNKEWLDYLAHNAPDELSAWFDAEHVESKERALDGDTAALNAKIAELQEQVDALRSRHCPHYDATEHTCDVHRTRIAELTAEREQYRKLFGMALDWAHEITMLESSVDEGMA